MFSSLKKYISNCNKRGDLIKRIQPVVNATDCNKRRSMRRRVMQKKLIDFQKLVLSIAQREKEEEEKKSIPSNTHTHIHTYMHTYIHTCAHTHCAIHTGKRSHYVFSFLWEEI